MSQPIPIKAQLLDLFNDRLLVSGIDTQYTLQDLTFGVPEPYDVGTLDPAEPEGANTSILVTAGEGLTQIQYRLHYCRLDLSRLGSIRPDVMIVSITPTSTHDLLEDLTTHVKFLLTEDDLIDAPIAEDTVTLTAKPTSVGVIGETSFMVIVD
jgi:hypothetical protein